MKVKVKRKQANGKNCIICGMENNLGVKAQFYEMENGMLCTLLEFKECHQSYPERVHGGMITALLDEMIGRVVWTIEPQTFGVTTSIKVDFKKPVPYGVPLKGVSYITKNSSRLFYASGELRDMDGNVLAKAEGVYLKMPKTRICQNESIDDDLCYMIADDVQEIDI